MVGTLTYARRAVEFDDRVLAHLQIVIVNRFRRGEAFLISWIDSVAIGGGRSSFWLSPTVPASFTFSGSRLPEIDQAWLERLDASAAAPTGLLVTDEHGAPLRVGDPGPPRPTSRR